MTDAERAADLDRRLAQALDANATLQRMLDRQSYQIERISDQLERALRELAGLRALFRKPAPPEPPPDIPPAGAGGAGAEAATPSDPPSRRIRPPPKKKASFGRSEIPAELLRMPDFQVPPPCPECGGVRLKELRSETVEYYDYIPAQIVVREVIRPVCRCMECQHIAAAPFPADLAPRLRATPALIGHILYEKYGRHLPLYRVDDEMDRLGAAIPQATRDRWLRWAAKQLVRLIEPLKAEMFALGLLHTDGTGFAVVTPQLGRRLGQMAVYCNEVATIYDFTSTKEGCHQRRFLGLEGADGAAPPPATLQFVGYQISDAASVADRTYAAGGITECGCNAHARRKFEDAEEHDRLLATEALAFWGELYAVEAEATRDKVTPAARLAMRRARSVPVAAELRRWLDQHHGTGLPKEPLTLALNYLHNHWDALFRFLTDGRIPIDNNPAERALKAIALGRKVYLFAGSLKAAERAALFYTFVWTCKQHKVNPEAWFADVLPRVRTTRPSHYAELLPTHWRPPDVRDVEPSQAAPRPGESAAA